MAHAGCDYNVGMCTPVFFLEQNLYIVSSLCVGTGRGQGQQFGVTGGGEAFQVGPTADRYHSGVVLYVMPETDEVEQAPGKCIS